MLKNKRKTSSCLKKNLSNSQYINFINLIKKPKNIIKFIPLLEDKKQNSVPKKTPLEILDSNNNTESEIKFTYNFIINKLDSLMEELNNNNYDFVYSSLIKIKNFINKIISGRINSVKKIKSNINILEINENKDFEKYDSSNNHRHSFHKKFDIFNEKEKEINSFNNKISVMNQTSSRFTKINNNSKIVKILKRKNSYIEDQFKVEKMKMLLCIGEQHKKIKELEKELNKKSIDSMPQDELKKYRCFPYYKKFDLLDNYTQQSKIKNKNKGKSFNHGNLLFDQKYNLNKSEKESDLVKSMIDCGEKIFNKRELEGNKVLDKDKSYFISHPKLKYIKGDLNMKTWKINDALDSLPQDILKHKFTSKSQKNNLIVFPSSLNQIIVNLEKLRIHNNFQHIEDEFRKNNLIKKEKNP